jgi:nicotinate phosphoribosyltransferase
LQKITIAYIWKGVCILGESLLQTMAEVKKIKINPGRKLFSATPEEILRGETSDIYFVRTHEILSHLDLAETPVTAEVFCRRDGIFAGCEEVMQLLHNQDVEVWTLPEGAPMQSIRFKIFNFFHRCRSPFLSAHSAAVKLTDNSP